MRLPLNIALVEDHTDLRELFVDFLRGQGHSVTGFCMADELDDFCAHQRIDLLILDLNLPGESGFGIATRLRAAHPELHIIMLTARTAVEDRIRGYASGADLYLCKPITPDELDAVVSSVARRVQTRQDRHTQLSLNPTTARLCGPLGNLALTPAEITLLKALTEAPDEKLDYWRLQELLALEPDERGKAALEVRISRLKRKLHDVGVPEPAIRAVWKEGYQLCVPVAIQS
ncbi:MAG: response regulator transcription factor [Rhodoferax sp.]|nr:response regulator transcription factor [Rhodoferax sp.]